MPAKVEGAWKSAQGDITLKQEFQKFSGSINAGGISTQVTGGKLRGDQISFSAGGVQYAGAVNGNTITGTVTTGGASRAWSATRSRGVVLCNPLFYNENAFSNQSDFPECSISGFRNYPISHCERSKQITANKKCLYAKRTTRNFAV